MPEGPEVWFLSELINLYFRSFIEKKTLSYGKHLFILDENENWSFGLTGRVNLTDKNKLNKVNSGWLYGNNIKYDNLDDQLNKLGSCFMEETNDIKIKEEISKWKKSKKKLAALILDQSKISGIGVAWGSEILFHCGLRPDLRTCDQNLDNLFDSILYIRNKIKNIYGKLLKENEISYRENINNWFDNLYHIREMTIYKKGTKIDVLGRNWWI
jgi:formamidopyrimidine-DNA glycosylase